MDAEVGLEVLHAVKLSVTLGAAEGAAAGRVEQQSGPLSPRHGLLRTLLLELLLALVVMAPQQAGKVEGLSAELTGVGVGDGVAEVAATLDMDSINLWPGFWDGSCLCWLKDGEL